MVGARACPLEPNDARWLAAELQDAFGDVDADMRRAAPEVSKTIDVALKDGSDKELELGAFRKMQIAGGTRFLAPQEKTTGKWGPSCVLRVPGSIVAIPRPMRPCARPGFESLDRAWSE
jgi:hypothetical protein